MQYQLRVIDEDVRPQNFGVHMAWRKAQDRNRPTWHQVVSMATLCWEFATKKKMQYHDLLLAQYCHPCYWHNTVICLSVHLSVTCD